MADHNPFRLPRAVLPKRYELTLVPDLASATFTGESRTEIEVKESTRTIVLNAAELDIQSAQVRSASGHAFDGQVSIDEEAETATIALEESLEVGDYTLALTFSGILNDKLRGFYRSTFKDEQGTEHVIATTQFEATDARRAFPCWDEPDFKAVYGVTLIVDNNLAAFSNASERSAIDLGNGKRQVMFEDTMKMSTYLVAFIVGPFVVTDPVDVDGMPLRVACAPGKENLTSFALETGTAALRYFAEYFKIPYPGDKLDLISIPDFAFGAMENLGCVTFRETALLVDPEKASRLEVERVADVVAHEIAHMWFGDLVTMKWWNGIWLNEAFATFMELLFVDHFRPEWDRWAEFCLSRSAAQGVDSLSSTRPIEFEVVRPEEAQGMFDLLTYEKGGAVLRMLEQHIGAHEFSVGISAYLHKHAYDNAETTDLWDALEESSAQPVRAMMDTWIFQGGHPIVRAELGDNGTSLKLTQKRFNYLSTNDDAVWHIPIGIRTMIGDNLHQEKLVLTERETVVELPGEPKFVLLNEHGNGFFRAAYEPKLLDMLIPNLHALDSLERFALVNDTWAATLAGECEVPQLLQMLWINRGDDDPSVWTAMVSPLRMLDKVVPDSERPELKAFVRALANPQHDWLGWEPHNGESERLATLRGVLIRTLGTLGEDEDVRTEARHRFAAFRQVPGSLNTNLVDAVQATIAATGNHDDYSTFVATFQNESETPQARINALGAFASFDTAGLVDRTLEMILDGTVRTQDAPYTLRAMLGSRESGPRVWEWCEEHWGELAKRFPDNSIARMLDGVTAQANPELAQRVEAFIQSHPVPQAQKLVDQTCERLRVNASFYERWHDNLKGAFTIPE